MRSTRRDGYERHGPQLRPRQRRARPLAEACGIRYLDGIEIDCVFQSLEFHVLGYGSDYHGKTKPAVRLTGYGELPHDFHPEELLEALPG